MEQIWLTLFGLAAIVVSIFLILLILVQRGRGGGLTGALGGMGGQSAFGSKAGDVFTRITVVTATIWILIATLMIALFNKPVREFEDQPGPAGAISGAGQEQTPLPEDEAPGESGALPGEGAATDAESGTDQGAGQQSSEPPPTEQGAGEGATGEGATTTEQNDGDDQQAADGDGRA